MIKPSEKFAISENIVFRLQEDRSFILLQIEGEKIFELKEVSAFIWDMITQEKNLQEILHACSEEYESFDVKEEKSILDFISEMIEKKIITQY